ncbi:4Fe-4S dicluster domain-containing protein [Salipiger abyssi]|uniref:4Fe-4S dicluster domain-containing protein n=1 Tax=Salipiger abyssi TaxID=1250539 RepID=UPI001A8F4F38|nr:4Fe-4S dicluster domain-containing protein [Salipiger abyssi]MBN9888125.1 hypothetical protein [Salipiger abyssi]
MSAKWTLTVDLDLCVNCHNCVLATKDEHIGNDFPGYSAAQSGAGVDTIRIDKHQRGSGTQVELTYVPRMCGHCDDAPCLKADTTGALRKREDGIVLLDPEQAHAPGLEALCPLGMIRRDAGTGAAHLWSFDAHLLDTGWEMPRAVQACPTSALQCAKLDNDALAQRVARDGLEVFPGMEAAKPRVYYKNMQRLTHALVAGTVLQETDGRPDCAAGITVALHEDGKERARTVTNGFGEFAFAEIPPQVNRIELRLSTPDGAEKTVPLELSHPHPVEIRL